jgi:hypothetical protein
MIQIGVRSKEAFLMALKNKYSLFLMALSFPEILDNGLDHVIDRAFNWLNMNGQAGRADNFGGSGTNSSQSDVMVL